MIFALHSINVSSALLILLSMHLFIYLGVFFLGQHLNKKRSIGSNEKLFRKIGDLSFTSALLFIVFDYLVLRYLLNLHYYGIYTEIIVYIFVFFFLDFGAMLRGGGKKRWFRSLSDKVSIPALITSIYIHVRRLYIILLVPRLLLMLIIPFFTLTSPSPYYYTDLVDISSVDIKGKVNENRFSGVLNEVFVGYYPCKYIIESGDRAFVVQKRINYFLSKRYYSSHPRYFKLYNFLQKRKTLLGRYKVDEIINQPLEFVTAREKLIEYLERDSSDVMVFYESSVSNNDPAIHFIKESDYLKNGNGYKEIIKRM